MKNIREIKIFKEVSEEEIKQKELIRINNYKVKVKNKAIKNITEILKSEDLKS